MIVTRKIGTVLVILVVLTMLATVYVSAETPTPEPEPAPREVLKVAIIMPGRIDDMAWNQAGYRSFIRLAGKLGPEIETAWVEGVYDAVDIVPAIRYYADKGYDLIIGHGFQFQDPIKEVAPDYPDISFLITAGWESAPNFSFCDVRTDQTGYLLGVLAAEMTETGKIGYIAGLEVAELARFAKGYELGAKSVNPDIDIRMVYTGHFHDVVGAKETAISLADAGVDVIATMGDGVVLGTIAGCKEKGIYVMGNGADISALAPELVLTSGVWHWDAVYEQWIEDYRAGIKGGQTYWADMANKGLELAPFNAVVAEDVIETIKELEQKIIAGEIETGGP